MVLITINTLSQCFHYAPIAIYLLMSSLNVPQQYTETYTNYIIKIMVRSVIEQCLPFMNCPVNIVKRYLSHCLRHEWEEYSNMELLIIVAIYIVAYVNVINVSSFYHKYLELLFSQKVNCFL